MFFIYLLIKSKNKMMKKLLFFLTLASTFSQAQNLLQDDLSLYNPDQQLSGQGTWTNNSSNPGGSGIATAGGTNANVLSSPISYAGYGSSAKSFQIKPNADGCGTPFTAVTEGSIYVGFVINLSAAQANSNSDFFRVLSGSNFNTSFRLYAINAGFSFYLSTAKGGNGNAIAQSALSYNFDQDHLVIVKYTQLPGAGDDIVSVYIDPNFADGEPAIPSATTNTGGDQSGNVDRLTFRQNWTNGMPTGKAGLVSVAKTWNELGFLPLATSNFTTNNHFQVDAKEAKQGVLNIQSSKATSNASLKIYAINGSLIDAKTISFKSSSNSIAINPIETSGIYIVEITDADQKFTQKIVVN